MSTEPPKSWEFPKPPRENVTTIRPIEWVSYTSERVFNGKRPIKKPREDYTKAAAALRETIARYDALVARRKKIDRVFYTISCFLLAGIAIVIVYGLMQ